MPITPLHPVPRVSQSEFKDLSYTVLGILFEIHSEVGRFFDERIYKQELKARLPSLELEFPILVSHEGYSTTYYVDAILIGGAFEVKTAESLTPRHRGQLLNYLLMLDMGHGLLLNLRPESVQHEFVNAMLRPIDRHEFTIDASRWDQRLTGSEALKQIVSGLVHDWGTGLETAVYESAVVELLGGKSTVLMDVPVSIRGRNMGSQTMRLAADGMAFRITGFEQTVEPFEAHARKLLRHVKLQALLWVNIAVSKVTFTTIKNDRGYRVGGKRWQT
jgi:GxxExxY protein